MQASFSWARIAHAAPVREIPRRAGVDVVAARFVEEFGQSQDDADQVVEAALVVRLLHGWSDLVVGLGDYVFHADHARVVAQCAKGINTGHASGVQLQTSATSACAANCFALLYLPDCT